MKEKLKEKTKGPAPNFKIDVLKINIEQVVVEDGSKTPPIVEAYDLNLKDKTIYHVNSVSKLVGILMVETLKPTALQSAGLYAATTLLGVGFLPGLAIGVAIANDKATFYFSHPKADVYQKTLQLVQGIGQIKRSNDQAGQIASGILYQLKEEFGQ